MEDKKPIEIPGRPRLPDETDMDYHDRIEKTLREERMAELDTAAIKALESILADDSGAPAAAIVSAATQVLNRTRGKPPETIHHAGENGGPIMTMNVPITSEQLTRFVKRHVKETEADA